ncbi:MAG: 3-ketoacyl-ACP reductase [Mesorhizobium amorphae]|nr:MAG: 3-ketoacyl-ACP reductase [Mesorhizobium amorphae]
MTLALVTGGNSGIGLSCAAHLAAAGFDILVADLASAPSPALKAAVPTALTYHQTDIGDLASHAGLVAAAPSPIACLVNNAGIGAPVRGDLLDLRPENFDRVIDVNLRGTVFLSQAVARAMVGASGPRSIITITSVSAELASPERADYCVSKAALSMWVKNLALRLAPETIGVFELRPGIIRTGMTAGVSEKYDRLIEGGLVPAGRWGEPDDIGRIAASLATGQFGFATGSVIHADGGLSVGRL